jgi:hypothetical protein
MPSSGTLCRVPTVRTDISEAHGVTSQKTAHFKAFITRKYLVLRKSSRPTPRNSRETIVVKLQRNEIEKFLSITLISTTPCHFCEVRAWFTLQLSTFTFRKKRCPYNFSVIYTWSNKDAVKNTGDMAPCGSCYNRRFVGMCHLHLQGGKNPRAMNNVNSN